MVHQSAHFGDGRGQADAEGAADQVVADIEFVQVGYGEEFADIVGRDAVAGVDDQPGLVSHDGSGDEFFYFDGAGWAEGIREGAGVKFDHFRARPGGGGDLAGFGIDEQADFKARLLALPGGGGHDGFTAGHVQSSFGGDFLTVFRDEADDVGPHVEGDGDDFRGQSHFEIDSRRDIFPHEVDIGILDVTAVFAQVNGDLVGSAGYGIAGGLQEIGFNDGQVGQVAEAGLPKRSHVVDIDAELETGHGMR
jgi:hypothetical protein